MANGSQNMTTYLTKGVSSVFTTNASNSNNLLYINTTDTNITADMLGATTSIAFTRANITGAYTTGHIVWLNAANIGTPFQLVVHDSSDLYLYKRWKSSGAWTVWSKMSAGHADDAARITGNLAAATSDINRNIWVSSTASADGIPNYISGFNMNPSTKVFTVPAGTRISPNAGSLYLGNSGNQNWVYIQDMCSQDGQKWKIHQNGNAEFNGTVTAPTFSGNATSATTASKCSSEALTDIALTWASSYSTGSWMLIYNGEKGSNGGVLFRAINQANTAAWVDGAHKWARIGGDTFTGNVNMNHSGESYFYITHSTGCILYLDNNGSNHGLWSSGYYSGSAYTSNGIWIFRRASDGYCHCDTRLYGAVWNDYAEFRAADIIEPGRVVIEQENGIMTLNQERLAAGARIISDTFGFAIGETKKAKTPIAIAGRVLVYPYQEKSKYQLGAAVCAASNGTVDIMTREEIMMYPDRIIGTVSEIPEYNEWHAGENDGDRLIQINGRIWIYVR